MQVYCMAVGPLLLWVDMCCTWHSKPLPMGMRVASLFVCVVNPNCHDCGQGVVQGTTPTTPTPTKLVVEGPVGPAVMQVTLVGISSCMSMWSRWAMLISLDGTSKWCPSYLTYVEPACHSLSFVVPPSAQMPDMGGTNRQIQFLESSRPPSW